MHTDNWKPKKIKPVSTADVLRAAPAKKKKWFSSQTEDSKYFRSVQHWCIWCGVTPLIFTPARAEEEGAGVADITYCILKELTCRYISCSIYSWAGWKL